MAWDMKNDDSGIAVLGYTRRKRIDGIGTKQTHTIAWCHCGWRLQACGITRSRRNLIIHTHLNHGGPALVGQRLPANLDRYFRGVS